MDMKYVILNPINELIIFSPSKQHSDFRHQNVKSAGFIKFHNDKAHCYGNSISLNIKSDIEDSNIANKQIYGV